MEKIILASASPRRKELLEKAGAVFRVITADNEEHMEGSSPGEIVENLSAQKALCVAGALLPGDEARIIIGADTIVAFEGKMLGKPADTEDAVQTLRRLQGNTHQVFTGVTVLYKADGEWKRYTFAECTDVTFYPVTEEEIRSYVATGEPMDKAGSYGIQGLFGIYVKGIRGDYNNVVGLPAARLFYEMKKKGIYNLQEDDRI